MTGKDLSKIVTEEDLWEYGCYKAGTKFDRKESYTPAKMARLKEIFAFLKANTRVGPSFDVFEEDGDDKKLLNFITTSKYLKNYPYVYSLDEATVEVLMSKVRLPKAQRITKTLVTQWIREGGDDF